MLDDLRIKDYETSASLLKDQLEQLAFAERIAPTIRFWLEGTTEKNFNYRAVSELADYLAVILPECTVVSRELPSASDFELFIIFPGDRRAYKDFFFSTVESPWFESGFKNFTYGLRKMLGLLDNRDSLQKALDALPVRRARAAELLEELKQFGDIIEDTHDCY